MTQFPQMTGLIFFALTFAVGVSAPSAICHAVDAQPAENSAALRILPARVELRGHGSSQRLLVERFDGDVAAGPVAGDVQLVSDNPGVAIIDGDRVVGVGDGTATIRLAGADSVACLVKVHVDSTAPALTFRNHVVPVLSKLGCNSGACHGALAGKGGFRLSLRGYDPGRDWFNIVEQQQGRRIERSMPAASLLLTKPTTAVPHKGGLRLQPSSLDYRTLARWIAEGALPPSSEDAALDHIEVLPKRAVLKHGQSQPLLVRAHYEDGHVEDVTHWARYSSADEAIATVSDDGTATVVGPGEGAVMVWFSSQIVMARLTVPYDQQIEPTEFTHASRRNFIDELVLDQLRRLQLRPSPRSDDHTFIRRAFLDTIGVLPTAEEVRQFVSNPDPARRDALIESLFDRPEFVDFHTYLRSDLLLINGTELRPEAVKAYYQWIRGHVEANTPWDQFVSELVTARGSSFANGATNFYALHQTPEDMAENVSQAFLGLSIGCAKCHNHPLEKWTNDQYYAFASLFARVRAKGWGGDSRNGDGLRTLVTVNSGELVQPRTGRPQQPAPLDEPPIPFDYEGDRRVVLAEWLTSADNSLFARSITNRVWKNFMGVGLVEDVDDMRGSNPASNEELLTALADYLVEQQFDLQALMRVILQSETYQRSSATVAGNEADERYYSRYFPRRLMAEVLLDATSQATNVPSRFTQIVFPGADKRATDFYPEGTRAIQLYDSAVDSYFLQTFGRNQRRITCECERSDEPSIVQALHMSNGNTLNEKLSADDNRITDWLVTYGDDHQRLLDEMFLTTLGRFPTDVESSEMLSMIAAAKPDERRVLLEDMLWSILTCREFVFNH
jgi:hypothetical protein